MEREVKNASNCLVLLVMSRRLRENVIPTDTAERFLKVDQLILSSIIIIVSYTDSELFPGMNPLSS